MGDDRTKIQGRRMIVACTKCNSKYKIPEDKIAAGGVKVRCSKCKHMFFINKDGSLQTTPPTSGVRPPTYPHPAPLPPKEPSTDRNASGSFSHNPGFSSDDMFSGPPSHASIGDSWGGDPWGDDRHAGLKSHESPPALPPFPEQGGPSEKKDDDQQPFSGEKQDPFADIDLDDAGTIPGGSGKKADVNPAPGGAELGGDPFQAFSDPFVQPSKPPTTGGSGNFLSPSKQSLDQPFSDPFFGIGDREAEGQFDDSMSRSLMGSGVDGGAKSDPGSLPSLESSGLELQSESAASRKSVESKDPDPFRSPLPNLAREPVSAVPRQMHRPAISKIQNDAQSDPTDRKSILWQIGFWFFLLMIGCMLFVVYRNDGRPDFLSWSTYVRALSKDSWSDRSVQLLDMESISSTTYRNHVGRVWLLAWGKARNPADRKKNMLILGELMGPDGRVLRRAKAPIGVVFDPLEIHQMTDLGMVWAGYRSKLSGAGEISMESGASLPFMLIFEKPQAELDGARYVWSFAQSEKPLQENFLSPAVGFE